MRHVSIGLAILLSLASLTSCIFATPSSGGPPPLPPLPPQPGTSLPQSLGASVHSAWLAGDMQGVGSFEGDAYEIDTRYSDSITVHAGRGTFGWVMIRLETSGSFDSDNFRPGAVHSSLSAPLSAVGCSGPSHGNYVFDGQATRVEVEVERGDDDQSRLYHFRAEYPDGQYTEGGFILGTPAYEEQVAPAAAPFASPPRTFDF